jgi:hypothetical protein
MNKTKLASLLLRLGLASVLLYAAVGATLQPSHWLGFLPAAATAHLSADLALKLFAFVQFALAVWLLSNWLVKWAAAIMTAMMIVIIVTNLSSLDVTFRDFAIVFAAAALFVLN